MLSFLTDLVKFSPQSSCRSGTTINWEAGGLDSHLNNICLLDEKGRASCQYLKVALNKTSKSCRNISWYKINLTQIWCEVSNIISVIEQKKGSHLYLAKVTWSAKLLKAPESKNLFLKSNKFGILGYCFQIKFCCWKPDNVYENSSSEPDKARPVSGKSQWCFMSWALAN